MSIFRRGKCWWYAFTVGTVRYQGKLPQVTSKREAQNLEYFLRLSAYGGREATLSGRPLNEFVDEVYWPWALANYSTPRQTHWSHVAAVKQFFGKLRLDEITPMRIEAFKQVRVNTPTRSGGARSPGTVNRELGTLSRILSMARDNGLIAENPARRVRKLRNSDRRSRYLAVDEQERLFAVMVGRYAKTVRPVVIFALNTGMRRGEILSLKWADVEWERNVIVVRRTKNGYCRQVPINRATAGVLNDRFAVTGGNRVFKISAKGLSSAFRKLTRKAGIEDLRLHDLRHTFATRLCDAGADPFTIADILGHRSVSLTSRYTHVLEVNRQRAVAALAEKY